MVDKNEFGFLTEQQVEIGFQAEAKEIERAAIRALITAKIGRLTTLKQNSTISFNELAEAMFQQTSSVLPDALEGALQGKTGQAAKDYLKNIQRPDLKTPIKEG